MIPRDGRKERQRNEKGKDSNRVRRVGSNKTVTSCENPTAEKAVGKNMVPGLRETCAPGLGAGFHPRVSSARATPRCAHPSDSTAS